MGLGNCYYAMGQLEQAGEAFRRAVELRETSGDAFNNLAHVLAERKQYDAAIEAAREAVRLGGPNQAIYRETLERVMESKDKGD